MRACFFYFAWVFLGTAFDNNLYPSVSDANVALNETWLQCNFHLVTHTYKKDMLCFGHVNMVMAQDMKGQRKRVIGCAQVTFVFVFFFIKEQKTETYLRPQWRVRHLDKTCPSRPVIIWLRNCGFVDFSTCLHTEIQFHAKKTGNQFKYGDSSRENLPVS